MSIGLGLDGPETTTEGDYTLGVSAGGPVGANAEITVNWGDGYQTDGVGPGDYAHSLFTSGFNYEGDVPLTDYTITAQAVARVPASISNTSINDAAVDSLGRRVTVGTASTFWQIRRFAADGSLDGTFGNGGVVELNFGGGAYAVAIDSANRVVVGGQNGLDEFSVARLNVNGGLDSSFSPGGLGSDGPGVATVPFGADSRVSAIAIQPDGKIVAAGNSGTVADAGFGDFVVARFHGAAGGVAPNDYQAGDLDTTFDFDGKAITPLGGVGSSLGGVTVGASGRIVTVGTHNSAGAVVTFTAAGAADGTYFIDEYAGSEQATAVAVGGDGSILVAESAGNGELILAKLTAGGAADVSFGDGGAVIYDYEPLGDGIKFDSTVASLIVEDDLSIVAGGTLVNPVINNLHGGKRGLAVFRFDAKGNKDLGFDGDGVVYTDGGASLGVFSGQLARSGDTLIQSGVVGDGSSSSGMGVYIETATYAVAVTNVEPTASFAPTDTVGDPDNFVPPSNLPTAVPGEYATFAFKTTDPSVTDFSLLTYHIDWGDGTTEMLSSGGTYFPADGSLFNFAFQIAHAFEASGTLTVTLTVSDDDGGSSVATFSVIVADTSGIVSDPVNPGQTVLYYAAPANPPANKIHVSSGTSSTSIVLDGATVFSAALPADRVVVYGNYGDDMVEVNGSTSAARMEFYGGPGNDKLKGANQADVLVGGAGNDMAVGGAGRDLLAGGFGEDKVIGDADDDILIGGEYVDAVSREAVAAVMAEWTSSGTYTERVDNLRHGVTSPNGFGPYGLVGYETAQEMSETFGQLVQNIFDDGSVDKLTGDAGTDWFFANVDGAAKDKITDLLSTEFTDSDREFATT